MADVDYGDTETAGDDKPKGLRSQLEATLEENKTLKQELANLQSAARERSVTETLKAKGVNPKIAKFIPADVASEEQVSTWLTENADVFGFTVTDTPAGENASQADTPVADSADVQAARQLQGLSQQAAPPSIVADLESRIAGAKSEAEVDAIWADAQKYFL
jgi:hypothetical protein